VSTAEGWESLVHKGIPVICDCRWLVLEWVP
jgi:hypothetical protein